MKSISRNVIFLICLIGAGPSSEPASQPAGTALEAAMQYTDLFRVRRPAEAIEKFWDFDGMFVTIFGDDMKNVSEAEKIEMRDSMLKFLKRIYANPGIADAMSRAEFKNFTATDVGNGRQKVTFTAVFGYDNKASNFIVLMQRDGRWVIIDAGAAGQSLSESVAAEYKATRDKVTPPQYIKAITSVQ